MRSHLLPCLTARRRLPWRALLRVLLSLLLSPAAPALADTFPSTLLVATSGGVNQYRYNPTTGQTTPYVPPWVPSGEQGKGRIIFHPSQRFAYRVHADKSSIAQFAVEKDGRLTLLATTPATNLTGELAVHPFGTRLYVPASASAPGGGPSLRVNEIGMYPILPNGRLEDPTWIRVPGAGVSALAVDQTGRYLFAANTWTNEVIRYRIDRTTGVPFEPKTLSTEFLHWPVALAVSANNTHLYVANRAASQGRFTVTQCRINSQGELALLTPAEVPVAGGSPVMVAVDREGRFASVVSAEFHVGEPGTVSRFRIGRDGGLTPFQTVSAGRGANAIAVAAGFAFVANSRGPNLSRYLIDPPSGKFKPQFPSLATGGRPSGVAITVPDELRAQQDMVQRAAGDPHFGLPITVTFGTPVLEALDPNWQIRKLLFEYFDRQSRHLVAMLHWTSTLDPAVRCTNYVHPLTGQLAGFQCTPPAQAVATVRAAVGIGRSPQALLRGAGDAAWRSGEDGADDETRLLLPELDEESMRELTEGPGADALESEGGSEGWVFQEYSLQQ